MKLLLKLFFILFVSSLSFQVGAEETNTTRADAFIFFAQQYKDEVPNSYQYIDLQYTDIQKNSQLEDALQILVYLDLIKNVPINIGAEKIINADGVAAFAKKLGKKTPPVKITISSGLNSGSIDLGDKQKILEDVYTTISQSHYDRGDFQENQLTQGAIKGIAQATGDKYTSYFPPVESDQFFENLDGEFEGIGAYVEMQTPGQVNIISPIVGSPAEKAGVKGGDIVTHVDDKKIGEDNSLSEVITWIKGPKGTQVKLTILRDSKTEPIELYVTRDTIIINDIEHKALDKNTYYIQIKNFGDHVDTEFKTALEAVVENKSINKIIFDVRNNPGGYLGEVSKMLSYFLEEGQATAIVDYGNREINYSSLGYDLIDLSNYELIFLQNGGSASASEIMVGTVKDYFPETVIIGEQSYGKGSVQSIKTYNDGSTLKFTSAKWFTGNTRQGIDGIGISPDIELEFDNERWETFKKDNQLEKAISY